METKLPRCFHFARTAFLITIYLVPLFLLAQSGNLDQIRNGPANDPAKNFYLTFSNPEWVNGNAGASNAHYVEGMSIAYRSLITGATAGASYEYVIEYDTRHSGRMAIDYLTHFQRLEPHGPFGHAAETINPRIFKSGSKEYILGTVSTNTFPIPAPFQAAVNTPVAGMPQNSFNALPAGERLMTIYNGTITSITYDFQQSLTTNATESSTRVRVRFTAGKDSVVLAWGGHIASRLDWGYLNPTTPRSASGISGSPYHMRQISMNTYPGLANISGVGNQDRSLAAAAVIPPPECLISPAQLACPETASLSFSYTGATTGSTFLWSVNAGNTAGAQISGSATGSTVQIVPIAADFVPGGTFNLTLAVTKNGITSTCTLNPASTIQNVQVTATASPTTINFATGNTSQLTATATPGSNTDYTFSWTQDPPAGGSLSATNISNPVFTATAAGTYTFVVTATQIAAPNCSAKDTVVVTVESSSPPCTVTGPSPVCPGSTNSYCAPGPPPANFSYTWSVVGDGTISGAANGECVSVVAAGKCGTYTVKLHIESTSGLIKSDCEKVVAIEDKTSPTVVSCPSNGEVECPGTPSFGNPQFTDDCDKNLDIGFNDVRTEGCGNTYSVTRTWTATDDCGNTATCSQTIAVVDKTKPSITCPGPVSVQCDSEIPVADITKVTASDGCSNATVTWEGDVSSGSCPKIITRTYKATDDCGNSNTCTQTITVNDITPPVISCPQDVTINCSDNSTPTGTGTATATDNCGTVKVDFSDAATTKNCFRYIDRTWTATDLCGNSASCTQRIILVDRTAPVFTCVANIQVNCGDPIPTPAVTDNCSPNDITILFKDVKGSASGCTSNPFNLTRTWTAIDGSGNMSTCVQIISFVNSLQLTKSDVVKTEPVKEAIAAKQTPKTEVMPLASKKDALLVKAIPNPYTNSVNFRFVAPESGLASIILYDLKGARLGVAYNAMVKAGSTYNITYEVPLNKRVSMVYRLNIGEKSARGVLIASGNTP